MREQHVHDAAERAERADAVAPQAIAEAPASDGETPAVRAPSATLAEMANAVARLIDIEDVVGDGREMTFFGRHRGAASADYLHLGDTLRGHGYSVTLVASERTGRVAITVAPSAPDARRWSTHPWWHALLFLATLATTTWAGALHQGVNLLDEPARWPLGLPYALALLAILGVHEMGHYLAARRRGVRVTLPYFIPVPGALGTFGAFIRMRGVVRDRATYFDVAVAGPLAGLAAALVALAVGLPGAASGAHGGMVPSSSLLFAAVYALAAGGRLDQTVALGPLAFAGWLGLIVTALNLIPVGQLDGGHIAYAWLGRRRASALGTAVLVLMATAGVLYSRHWLMWAFIVWLVAGQGHPPALDERTPIGRGRTVLAAIAFALLLAIILPWPA